MNSKSLTLTKLYTGGNLYKPINKFL